MPSATPISLITIKRYRSAVIYERVGRGGCGGSCDVYDALDRNGGESLGTAAVAEAVAWGEGALGDRWQTVNQRFRMNQMMPFQRTSSKPNTSIK